VVLFFDLGKGDWRVRMGVGSWCFVDLLVGVESQNLCSCHCSFNHQTKINI